MSRIPVAFHPEALAEAEAAVRWYAERSVRAAERFLKVLEDAVEQVVAAPSRWGSSSEGTRRVILQHYPYLLIYRVLPDRIEILAVAHGRRRPGYWRIRTES